MIAIDLDRQARLFRRKYIPAIITVLHGKNTITTREVQSKTGASYAEVWKCLNALSKADIVYRTGKTFTPNQQYLRSPKQIVLNPFDARVSCLFRSKVLQVILSALFTQGRLEFETLMEFAGSDDMTLRRALAILIDSGLVVRAGDMYSLDALRIVPVADRIQYVPQAKLRTAVEAFLKYLKPTADMASIIVYGKASRGLGTRTVDLFLVVEDVSNVETLRGLVNTLGSIRNRVEEEYDVTLDIAMCSVLDWCNHILGYVHPPSISIMRARWGIVVSGDLIRPDGERYLRALSRGLTETEFQIWINKGYVERRADSWQLTHLGFRALAQKPPTKITEEDVRGIRIITTIE
jgi:predicted transcriptional regulator